jgi:hypothetical protein
VQGELNVGKCKSITCHPVEFPYIVGGVILDRVIIYLEVIMDSKISFAEHVDIAVGKALAKLGFVKRMSSEFRDPYTIKTLYVSLVRLKVEYASCPWRPFYDAHVNRIEWGFR